MNSTDHLFPEETNLSVRAGLTAFPESIFPLGEERNPLLDHMIPNWSKNAEIAVVDFRSSNIAKLNHKSSKQFLFIAGRVPSPIADGHRISIKIDTVRHTILYKDPYGSRAPASVAKWIKNEFPGFTYRECPISQQRDDISCTWISFANIVAGLEGKDIDPNIQNGLDDFKYRVLQSARTIWPSVKQSTGMGHCADPIEFHCFQHLKNRGQKPATELVLRREDLPKSESGIPKTFILHGVTPVPPTKLQTFLQRLKLHSVSRRLSKT